MRSVVVEFKFVEIFVRDSSFYQTSSDFDEDEQEFLRSVAVTS